MPNKGAENLMVWVGTFAAVLAVFYGLDHLFMSLQGLPLNPDLSPATAVQ